MPRIVVLDTGVLTNLVRANLCAASPLATELKFVVPEAVLDATRDRDHRTTVERAIADGIVRLERVERADALATYLELKDEIGRCEAECLAIAANDAEWLLGSDERRHFRRVATQRIGAGRIVSTPRIILWMVMSGALNVDEADHAKATLETHGFRMAFASFREQLR